MSRTEMGNNKNNWRRELVNACACGCGDLVAKRFKIGHGRRLSLDEYLEAS